MLKGEEKGGLRNVLGLLDRETTGEHRTGFRKQNEAQEGELLKKEEGRDESNVVKRGVGEKKKSWWGEWV